MRPTSVRWARALLAKDDSLAKARKVSKLNKLQWKTFYDIVKWATQSELGQRVRALDVAEQNHIIQDLAPQLAAKNIPPVDEPIYQYAIKRTQTTWMKEEQRILKKARDKWYSFIKDSPIDNMAPWNKLRGNLTSVIETFPTTKWSELTTDQKNDLKAQLANRCSEQNLPAPNMELIKAMLNRLHAGVLNIESRTSFSKKPPITQDVKPGFWTWKPSNLDMGDGELKGQNLSEAWKSREKSSVNMPLGEREDAQLWDEKGSMEVKTREEPKKGELFEFIRKTPVSPKATRETPVGPWGHETMGEERKPLPFIRKTLQR